MNKFIFTAVLFFGLAFTTKLQAQIIYVDSANVSGVHNGLSWATAFNDFRAGVNAAGMGDTVWIAKGTYQPAFDSSFSMKNGVKIYGGFSDTATVLSSRDWGTNATILLGNDSIVISNLNIDGTSLLDGFTITGGRITNNGIGFSYGGAGMLNNNSSPVLVNLVFSNDAAVGSGGEGGGMLNLGSSPVLTNVIFINDSAEGSGGGMFNDGGTPVLTNVVFFHDVATSQGGAMLNESSSPILTNVVFSNDIASVGGGMASYASSPILTNVIFSNDTAITNGGGIYDGGASPILTNITFYQNDAADGGGIMNSGHCAVIITNNVFWENTAVAHNPDIYDNIDPSIPTIVTNSFTQTVTPGTGNIQGTSDPFINDVNPIGPDGIWMTPDDGLELKGCINNPAVNTGNNTANTTTMDIAGQPRVVNSIIDMGAYESQSGTPVNLFITPPVAVCSPATVDLTDPSVTAGSTPGLSFFYYTDSTATRILSNPGNVKDSGTYYIVGTMNGACASDTASVLVAIIQSPVVSIADTSLTIDEGYGVTLQGNVGNGAPYSWNSNYNINNEDTLYPFVYPLVDTFYTLKATSPGCTASATAHV